MDWIFLIVEKRDYCWGFLKFCTSKITAVIVFNDLCGHAPDYTLLLK